MGRALKDDEDVSIMAFGTEEALTGGARPRAAQKLEVISEEMIGPPEPIRSLDRGGPFSYAQKRLRPATIEGGQVLLPGSNRVGRFGPSNQPQTLRA